MSITLSIRYHIQPFFRNYILCPILYINFSHLFKILCTPIPIVFFSSFPTWGSCSHFIRIKYKIRGPIGRNIICFNSPSGSFPYSSSPPYLCFPFIGGLYAYKRSCIICCSFFLQLQEKVFSIMVLIAIGEMCSLVSTGVGPLYITSS
jgi:hypothetical protein